MHILLSPQSKCLRIRHLQRASGSYQGQKGITQRPWKVGSHGMKLPSVPSFPGSATPWKLANPLEMTPAPGFQELGSRCLPAAFPQWGSAFLPAWQKETPDFRGSGTSDCSGDLCKVACFSMVSHHRRCWGPMLSSHMSSLPRFSGSICFPAKQNRAGTGAPGSASCCTFMWSPMGI